MDLHAVLLIVGFVSLSAALLGDKIRFKGVSFVGSSTLLLPILSNC